MEEYKDIKDMLRPRRDFAASDGLRSRISSTLDSSTRPRRSLRWLWGAGASCVAAAVLILILIPTGMSAKDILAQTLGTLRDTSGVEMTVEVRTRPMENFRYINLNEEFVVHNILIARSDSAIFWRIDKGGRTAAGNDHIIFTWIDSLNIGWRFSNGAPEELLGEMAILLAPEKILESELQNCIDNPDARYSVERRGQDIFLTVQSEPQGEFSNPYMLNASIAESESIRRYVIDADTRQLRSASVSVLNGGRATEVLKVMDIIYGHPQADLLSPPPGVRFIDISSGTLAGLTGLTATEAATVFLCALESWDLSVLERAMDATSLEAMYRNEFQGSVLDSIGHSFVSGSEGNTYVPYSLVKPDGSVKRHNLTLQQNTQGGWTVIGGL